MTVKISMIIFYPFMIKVIKKKKKINKKMQKKS